MRNSEEQDDPWLRRMTAEKPPKLVAVALANKMARITWALSLLGAGRRCCGIATWKRKRLFGIGTLGFADTLLRRDARMTPVGVVGLAFPAATSSLNPLQCQPMTVSGLTFTREWLSPSG